MATDARDASPPLVHAPRLVTRSAGPPHGLGTASADVHQERGLLLTHMPCLQQALLFRHRLQDLPPRDDPWDKGLTSFRLERGFAQGIVVLHRHEGVGDLPGQLTVGVTVGGKATMTVAGASPK